MLDTQVYSNTGGQNSDSSLMTGGFDMNQIGAATQGKLIEKKGLAEIFVSGHGSPYVGQVSMANAPKFYKAVLDALEYRGTGFLQAFTTCQPEHEVGDDVSTLQAQRARDSRLMPEFTFAPARGESYREALEIKGTPAHDRDWWEKTNKATGEKFRFTVAHYAATEARFRQHLRRIDEDRAATLVHLDDLIWTNKKDVPYIAYSGKCPHLGCGFKWRTQKTLAQVFLWPWHLSIYDAAGKVLDGPAPRALDPLPIKVTATGDITIIDMEFKAGTKAQVRIV